MVLFCFYLEPKPALFLQQHCAPDSPPRFGFFLPSCLKSTVATLKKVTVAARPFSRKPRKISRLFFEVKELDP
jgi:hypothetical protein